MATVKGKKAPTDLEIQEAIEALRIRTGTGLLEILAEAAKGAAKKFAAQDEGQLVAQVGAGPAEGIYESVVTTAMIHQGTAFFAANMAKSGASKQETLDEIVPIVCEAITEGFRIDAVFKRDRGSS